MVTKTQKTQRNKHTIIKGNMEVPPWNGQGQMSLGGLNLVYERLSIASNIVRYVVRIEMLESLVVCQNVQDL